MESNTAIFGSTPEESEIASKFFDTFKNIMIGKSMDGNPVILFESSTGSRVRYEKLIDYETKSNNNSEH